MIKQSYIVSCEDFEGPLDLLLYLVRKQEVGIRDISLSRITREYLLSIRGLQNIDFDGAGEFIRYAATLLAIKAREMTDEGIYEYDDEYETRESLIRKLEEFKKFKERGIYLKNVLELSSKMYTRPLFDYPKGVNISLNKFKEILESIKKEKPFEPPTTILFHIEHLIMKLLNKLRELKKFLFSKIIKESDYREIVGLFFALLEIIRQGKAKAVQKKPFGEICVKKR